MRKVFIIVSIVMLFTSLSLGTVDFECKKTLTEKYQKGKLLVIKVDGVPTMVEKLPGNLGSKTYCMITIKPDGKWKVYSVLGSQSDSTNVLSEGDVLLITKLDIKSKSIQIFTRTTRAMHYDASGRTSWLGSRKGTGTGFHANIFTFKMKKNETCDALIERVEKYFDAYNKEEEIGQKETVEIKVGMTIEEVEKILGQPLKKATIGNKVIYKYEDWKITFVDGKVVDVDI
jgi:hypothetical protein